MASAKDGSVRAGRRAAERSLRQADVVTAATAVFAEKGFQGAQMSEIASAAELSTKSMYTLFASKEALYEEVIRTASEAVRDRVQARVEALSDPREQILALIDGLFECFDEQQDLLLLYTTTTHGLPWRVRQSMGESSVHIMQEFTDWVVGLARRARRAGLMTGLDPETVAASLLGTITTVATRWAESGSAKPVSSMAPGVRALFERVLGEAPSD